MGLLSANNTGTGCLTAEIRIPIIGNVQSENLVFLTDSAAYCEHAKLIGHAGRNDFGGTKKNMQDFSFHPLTHL